MCVGSLPAGTSAGAAPSVSAGWSLVAAAASFGSSACFVLLGPAKMWSSYCGPHSTHGPGDQLCAPNCVCVCVCVCVERKHLLTVGYDVH